MSMATYQVKLWDDTWVDCSPYWVAYLLTDEEKDGQPDGWWFTRIRLVGGEADEGDGWPSGLFTQSGADQKSI